MLTWWRSPKEITPWCVGECTVYGKQGRKAVLRHCSSICSSSGLQRAWDHLRPHVLGDALAPSVVLVLSSLSHVLEDGAPL